MRSKGISGTSHAPNEGYAETRHTTPAFVLLAAASPHALRDAVRARPGRDLVLAEDVVRIQPQLEVVRVAGFLRDVPVRGDARRLEGDVANLARLLRDQVDSDRELRPRVSDVKLADA